MRYIECGVNNEFVSGAGQVIGAAGSHHDVALRITFGEMWDGLSMYVTFRDALGENPTVVQILPTNLVLGTERTYDVVVPAAPKAKQGKAMATVQGYTVVNGTQEANATNTATAYFIVLPSDYAVADDESIDATIAQQLQSEIDEISETVTDARLAAQDAEAWAVGQIEGEDVPETDERYENNSKYYAQRADESAAEAYSSASAAFGSASSASGSATAAAGSAATATDRATAAANSAAAAAGSATGAATSADNAAGSATAAAGSATAAATSASAAAGSEANAAASATRAASAAESAASDAASAAVQDVDTLMQGYVSSASGSASNAANFASAASTSETNAAASATSAAASEANAASSKAAAESAASTAASQAASQAAEAAASEAVQNVDTLMRGYVSAASVSAANATTSANAASNSESYAASSAARAAGSATAAAGSAESAAAAASNAATSETNAAASATTATQAAQTAAGQAAAIAAEQAVSAATDLMQEYATAAQSGAEDSEAWAVGQRGGQDVPSGDETYHNNARYWAEQAEHAAAGGVASFNGRAGIVAPQAGDYTAAMVGADPAGAANAVKPKSGAGKPTSSTVADFLGQQYVDTAEEVVYSCVKINGNVYTWVKGGGGVLELDRVYIDTPPTKTAYKAGEIFDPTGMVVKADFAISGVVVVFGQTIYDYTYPLTGLAAGTTAVTISVTKEKITKTVNQAVSVTKTEVAVPTLSGSYTYNGNTQAFAFNNEPNSNIATKSGDVSGLNAGSYTTRFTLNDTDLYVWADGSTAAYKDIAVTIGRKAPTLLASPSSVTLSNSALTATSTISCDGDGTLSVQSSDTSVATASIIGNTVTISSVNNTAGSATVTVTHTAVSGGNYSNGTTTIDVTASYIPTLESATWAQISEVSAAGKGDDYWDVGDTKSVVLSGTCGTLSLSTTLYCYILGFDHNSAKEGTGIHFGTWKTAATGGVDVCLVDSKYGTNAGNSGDKYFQMNHWGDSSNPYNTNYGGWKGCDARYDILGSTKTAPSGYGSTPTTSRVGYDAPTDTATSPVANTLMSCLPSALRAVMKPITKYTDNYGNSSNVAEHVTTSVDYLPLLSEWEIFGARTYANQYEQNSQAQYTYFASGNSKVKYQHSSTGSAAAWWERSPSYGSGDYFCYVDTGGNANISYSRNSRGLAPAFKV